MATPRALVYVRISMDRSGGGLGVARQEADCRQLADRLGWTIHDVLIDNDVSAYSGKPRPAYQRLLDHLNDGNADAVLAWHTDRLHRSPAELETFIDVVERAKAKVETVTAGPLDLATPSGRMVARMLGAAARYEVERTSERQKAKRAEKVANGEFVGGRRPFGYRPDGMRLEPAEADAIADATRHIIEGQSVRSIATAWNDAGITTTSDNRWHPVEVRRVLLRPRNAGLIVHHGKIAGTAKWPPIVDEPTWNACRLVLENPSRRTNPGPGRRWLGSGIYRCGVCDAPVKVATSKRGETNYRCADSYHMMRRALLVDELVEATVLARLSRPDVAELASPETPDLSAWHTEARIIRSRLTEVARMFADGTVDGAQLAASTADLRRQLAEVEARLAEASHVSTLARFAGHDPAVVWETMDLDLRRLVVEQLVTVTLMPGRKGRPAGWRPGEPYFDRSTVVIEPV